MHADHYYAPVDPKYWPTFAGVISMWGGFIIPKGYDWNIDYGVHEADFFKYAVSGNPPADYDNPPLICFHGGMDLVIPFYDGPLPPFFLPNQDIDLSPPNPLALTDYSSETLCTKDVDVSCTPVTSNTFSQKNASGVELKSLSSLNLYHVMKQLNKYSELYLDCSMAHGLDDDCVPCGTITNAKAVDDCTPCTYTSTFGSSATNQKTTVEYMAGRIAVFTQTIMASVSGLPFGATGESFFKDCENKRECNQTQNPTLCNTTTLCDGTAVFP